MGRCRTVRHWVAEPLVRAAGTAVVAAVVDCPVAVVLEPKAKRPAAQATRRAGSKKKEGAVLHANEVDVVGMANINEQLEDDLLMAKFMPQAQRGGIQDEYTVAKPGLDRLVQRVTAHTLGHGILTSAETYAVLSHATEVGTTDKG
eukprot:m.27120 g.27120  ORF g.27120 m.27120 type:complete len:146 (-) comp11754_c0_seq3:721-1158(-)